MPLSARFHPLATWLARSGLLGGLVLVLLAAVLWGGSLSLAQPQALPLAYEADGEMAYWVMSDADEDGLESSESALGAPRDLICRKPTPYKPGADQLLNEIADQDLPSCPALWIALMQGVPVQEPQPELPQIEPQPLLRPPAQLG
ncbi:MAG: hypothetical protein K2X75_04750 [Burkholderiaceae bacterium]|jgi:hypothetical protein|nr:hypothetical protein [Burkholderiaceae bacterium]